METNPMGRPCEACGADAHEPCRPWCLSQTADDVTDDSDATNGGDD